MSVPTYQEIKTLAQEVEDLAAQAEEHQREKNYVANGGNYFINAASVDDDDIEAMTQNIPAMFLQAASVNPEQLQSIIGDLETTKTSLAHDDIATQINNITNVTDMWDGDGVDALNEFFVKPIDQIRWNQITVIASISASIQSYKELLEEARKDVYQIAEGAKASFNKLLDNDSSTETTTLKVGTVLLTALIVAPTFGSGALVGAAALAATTTINIGSTVLEANVKADAKSHGKEKHKPIGGKNVQAVIDSIAEALKKVEEDVVVGEDQVKGKLEEALGTVDGNIDIYKPKLPKAILDAANSKNPEKLTGENGFGDRKLR